MKESGKSRSECAGNGNAGSKEHPEKGWYGRPPATSWCKFNEEQFWDKEAGKGWGHSLKIMSELL